MGFGDLNAKLCFQTMKVSAITFHSHIVINRLQILSP